MEKLKQPIDWDSLSEIGKNRLALTEIVRGRQLNIREKSTSLFKKYLFPILENSDEPIRSHEKDEDPLNLLIEKVDIGLYDSTYHTIYSLHLPRPIYGQQLIKLLTLSRPSVPEGRDSFNQDRYGIMADWIVTNRIGGNRGLAMVHKLALGSYWTEFNEHHLGRFMSAVEAATERGVRAALVQAAKVSVLGDKYSWDISEEDKQHYVRVEPNGLHPIYRVDWISTQGFDSLRPCLEDGIEGKTKKVNGLKKFKIYYNNSWATFEVNPEGTFKEKLYTAYDRFHKEKVNLRIVDEEIKNPRNYGLSPWILLAYPKDGGEPIYIKSQEPQVLRDEVGGSADTVVGLLLATHLSNDVREQLPFELSLKLRLLGGR